MEIDEYVFCPYTLSSYKKNSHKCSCVWYNLQKLKYPQKRLCGKMKLSNGTVWEPSGDGRTEKQWNKCWGGRPCVLSCLLCGNNCFSQLHFRKHISLSGLCVVCSSTNVFTTWTGCQKKQLHFIQHMSHTTLLSLAWQSPNTQFAYLLLPACIAACNL